MFLKEIYENDNSYVFLQEDYLGQKCITLYKIVNFKYLDWRICDFDTIDKYFMVRCYLNSDSDVNYLIGFLINKYIKK